MHFVVSSASTSNVSQKREISVQIAYLLCTKSLYQIRHTQTAIKSKVVLHTKTGKEKKKENKIEELNAFDLHSVERPIFPFGELRLSKHIKEHIYYNPLPSENYQLKIRGRASINSSQESTMYVHFPVPCVYVLQQQRSKHTSRHCE